MKLIGHAVPPCVADAARVTLKSSYSSRNVAGETQQSLTGGPLAVSVMIDDQCCGAGAGRSRYLMVGAEAGVKVRLHIRKNRINSELYSLRSFLH